MGNEDHSRLDSPESSPEKKNTSDSLYSSPISQPSRPFALSIPDPIPPEPRNLADEVGDMLRNSATRDAKPASPPVENPVEQAPPPTHCPNCKARLSSLDLKMGQCFKCNASLKIDNGPDRPSRGPITIGI